MTVLAPSSPPAATAPARAGWRHRLLQLLLLLAACTAVAAPLVALETSRNARLTPIDELTYIDYLYKVGDGHFVIGSGELISGEARREQLCRGVSRGLVEPDPVRCAGPLPAAAGRATADIDPPTYYVVTYAAARGLQALGVADGLVTAARLAGALWAGAGLAVLVLLCRELGASKAASAAAAAVALATPGLITQWHFVTPHATNVLVGALVALLVLRWDRHRSGAWALVVAGALPPLVKAPQVVVALAMALFLLIGAVWPGTGPLRLDRRRLVGAGVVLASLFAGSLLWLLVRAHYALTDEPPFRQLDVDAFQGVFLLENVGMFLRSWSVGAAAGLTLVVVVWCYGAAVGAASAPAADPVLRRLGLSLLALGSLGALVFVLSTYVLLGQYVKIPERYGFSLVPLALAVGAVALRSRLAVGGAGLVAAASLAAVLAYSTPG